MEQGSLLVLLLLMIPASLPDTWIRRRILRPPNEPPTTLIMCAVWSSAVGCSRPMLTPLHAFSACFHCMLAGGPAPATVLTPPSRLLLVHCCKLVLVPPTCGAMSLRAHGFMSMGAVKWAHPPSHHHATTHPSHVLPLCHRRGACSCLLSPIPHPRREQLSYPLPRHSRPQSPSCVVKVKFHRPPLHPVGRPLRRTMSNWSYMLPLFPDALEDVSVGGNSSWPAHTWARCCCLSVHECLPYLCLSCSGWCLGMRKSGLDTYLHPTAVRRRVELWSSYSRAILPNCCPAGLQAHAYVHNPDRQSLASSSYPTTTSIMRAVWSPPVGRFRPVLTPLR